MKTLNRRMATPTVKAKYNFAETRGLQNSKLIDSR